MKTPSSTRRPDPISGSIRSRGRNAGRGRFLVAVAALIGASVGCSQKTAQPLPPKCELDPLEMDFGEVLLPIPGQSDVVMVRDLSITNRVYVNSASGNAALAGSLTIRVESPQEVPVQVRVVPAGHTRSFDIPPRGTATFKLEARVTAETGTGLHTGAIDLGTPCGPIPYRLNVRVREEPQPTYLGAWTAQQYGFKTIQALDVDDEGDVYVADSETGRITRHDPTGRIVATYRSLGRVGDLWLPTGVASERKFHFHRGHRQVLGQGPRGHVRQHRPVPGGLGSCRG